MTSLKIAVVGAGLIGSRHIDLVLSVADCALAAIVDPAEHSVQLAAQTGAAHFTTLEAMLTAARPDGIIIATPNAFHVEQALQCISARIPALIEKPVAETAADGERLIAAAEAAAVPCIVGHHRHHGAIMRTAEDIVAGGSLGRLVAVAGSALYYKPDSYFEAGPWRREVGAGPILLNLIHDISNLRALMGEVDAVHAFASHEARGFAAEDTAAISLRFVNGALGTLVLSDTAASPRSWEHTSAENDDFPHSPDEDCYVITGTRGSLAIPTMRLKTFSQGAEPSWREPFERTVVGLKRLDPMVEQLKHFCAVIRGEASPRVTIRDGVRNVEICNAISRSARTGELIEID